MSDAYELWPNRSFGQNEHPPSSKLNAILQSVEKTRKFSGPFNIQELQATGSSYDATTTGLYIQFDDDPWQCGGVDTGTGMTRRSFQVFYYDGNETTTGFARWDDVYFTSGTIEGTVRWYAHLNENDLAIGTLGSGNLDLSDAGVSISSFTCYRYSG